MKAAPAIALGAAGLAWHASNGPGLKPVGDAHLAAASRVGMPCGVTEVDPEIHEVKTMDFFGRWLVQRASLQAEHGAHLGLPLADRQCALAWCNLWLDLFEDSPAGKALDKSPETITAALVGPLAARAFKLLEPQTSEVMQYHLLKAERDKAIAGVFVGEGVVGPWPRMRQVVAHTSRMAAAMDSAIRVNTETGLPSTGDLLKNSAKNVAQGIGDGFAFSIESILGPIIGTSASVTFGVLASTLAPYLAVGGAIYYARRTGKL